MRGKNLNKRTKLTIVVLILIVLIITALAIYIGISDIPGLKSKNAALKAQVTRTIFQKGLNEIVIDDKKGLEQIILDLKGEDDFNKIAYEDTIIILELSLLYIQELQVKMDNAGLTYPVFIADAVLRQILEEGIER